MSLDHCSGLVFRRPQSAFNRRLVVLFCSAILKRRQVARKRLNERENSVINRILSDLGLAAAGREVGRAVPAVRRMNNRSAVTKLLKAAVNASLGIERKQRNKPRAAELQHVFDQLDAIGDKVRDEIRKNLGEAHNA